MLAIQCDINNEQNQKRDKLKNLSSRIGPQKFGIYTRHFVKSRDVYNPARAYLSMLVHLVGLCEYVQQIRSI